MRACLKGTELKHAIGEENMEITGDHAATVWLSTFFKCLLLCSAQ